MYFALRILPLTLEIVCQPFETIKYFSYIFKRNRHLETIETKPRKFENINAHNNEQKHPQRMKMIQTGLTAYK